MNTKGSIKQNKEVLSQLNESLCCRLTTGNLVRDNNSQLCIQRSLTIINKCDIQHRSQNPSFATVSTDNFNAFIAMSSTKVFSHHRKCKEKIGHKFTKSL